MIVNRVNLSTHYTFRFSHIKESDLVVDVVLSLRVRLRSSSTGLLADVPASPPKNKNAGNTMSELAKL